ncbi:hypothetical protein KI387_042279, partial [Taxus chinensis]
TFQRLLLHSLYTTLDYAQNGLIAAVFFFKMMEWWYQSAEERLTSPTVYPPPPPPPQPKVAENGIPLPPDRTICPLCSHKRTNPTLVAVSGFVFCYPCIFNYVSKKHDIEESVELRRMMSHEGFEAHVEDVEPEHQDLPHLGKHSRESPSASDESASEEEILRTWEDQGSGGSGGSSGLGGSGGGGNTCGSSGSESGGKGLHPHQSHQVYYEMSLHLPEYRGIEDVTEHVHKCELLWCTKGITTSDRKASQFATTLQGHTHSWYRKYDPHQTAVDYNALHSAFLAKFHIPEFEQKSINTLKDIKQGLSKSVREYDTRFKTLLSNLSYDIHPSQHAQWFVGGFLTPFRRELSHKTF